MYHGRLNAAFTYFKKSPGYRYCKAEFTRRKSYRAGGAQHSHPPSRRFCSCPSLQCRPWSGQVRSRAGRVGYRQCVSSVEVRCRGRSRQVRVPRVKFGGGLGIPKITECQNPSHFPTEIYEPRRAEFNRDHQKAPDGTNRPWIALK